MESWGCGAHATVHIWTEGDSLWASVLMCIPGCLYLLSYLSRVPAGFSNVNQKSHLWILEGRHFILLNTLNCYIKGMGEGDRSPCLLSTQTEHRGSLASRPIPACHGTQSHSHSSSFCFEVTVTIAAKSRVASAALEAEATEVSQLETFWESPANHIHFLWAGHAWEKTANWASAKIRGSREQHFLKRMLGVLILDTIKNVIASTSS